MQPCRAWIIADPKEFDMYLTCEFKFQFGVRPKVWQLEVVAVGLDTNENCSECFNLCCYLEKVDRGTRPLNKHSLSLIGLSVYPSKHLYEAPRTVISTPFHSRICVQCDPDLPSQRLTTESPRYRRNCFRFQAEEVRY